MVNEAPASTCSTPGLYSNVPPAAQSAGFKVPLSGNNSYTAILLESESPQTLGYTDPPHKHLPAPQPPPRINQNKSGNTDSNNNSGQVEKNVDNVKNGRRYLERGRTIHEMPDVMMRGGGTGVDADTADLVDENEEIQITTKNNRPTHLNVKTQHLWTSMDSTRSLCPPKLVLTSPSDSDRLLLKSPNENLGKFDKVRHYCSNQGVL